MAWVWVPVAGVGMVLVAGEGMVLVDLPGEGIVQVVGIQVQLAVVGIQVPPEGTSPGVEEAIC